MKAIKSFFIGASITILIWFLAYIIIDSRIMPSPLQVLRAMPLLLNHNIFTHLWHSSYRVLVALVVSVFLGLVIGISASNKYISKVLTPFIYFTYPIPRVALLPVVMLTFGLRDTSKIIMIVLIIVYPITIMVRDSVKDIPKELLNTLTCLGATKFQVFFTVTLPWAASGILSSLRISLGTAIAILFFTESYGTTNGMGFFILDMWQRLNYVLMFAGIVVLSLSGFLLFVFIDVLEDILLKWKKKGSA